MVTGRRGSVAGDGPQAAPLARCLAASERLDNISSFQMKNNVWAGVMLARVG